MLTNHLQIGIPTQCFQLNKPPQFLQVISIHIALNGFTLVRVKVEENFISQTALYHLHLGRAVLSNRVSKGPHLTYISYQDEITRTSGPHSTIWFYYFAIMFLDSYSRRPNWYVILNLVFENGEIHYIIFLSLSTSYIILLLPYS